MSDKKNTGTKVDMDMKPQGMNMAEMDMEEMHVHQPMCPLLQNMCPLMFSCPMQESMARERPEDEYDYDYDYSSDDYDIHNPYKKKVKHFYKYPYWPPYYPYHPHYPYMPMPYYKKGKHY